MRKLITIAAAVTIGALAVTLPAHAAVTRPAHSRTLPQWAHWKTAPRGACGHGVPGIVVWAGHGDGVLVCSNGSVETS